MMQLPALNLYLFGPLRIKQNGETVALRRRKAQALLAYLAVTRQPHHRDALATLLWPEFNQQQARTNLRRELAELRTVLGVARLVDDRVTVQLNTAPPFVLDLADFQQHLAQARQCPHPGHAPGTDVCPACLPHLGQAAARYSDHFLAGFTLPDSPAFDDWHFFQADGLRQTLAQLLERLVRGHHAAHQFADAIPFARRWVALDPLHEPAHCQLMLAYERAGQHAAALRQYETCVRVLQEELGVPPAAETTALYEQIRQRVGGMGPVALTPIGPLRQAAGEAAEAPAAAPPFQAPAPPPHFVGRTVEITQLCAGLLQSITPIYALVGMGGAGKTTLAIQVTHLLHADFADGVLWANAVSSDPMDIAVTWARAYGYDFSGLADLESRAAALRGVLSEKAVLLVLDNVSQATSVRPLLPSGSQCAVLLTTRDLDAANALNAQVLRLGELSAAHSRQLLGQILGEGRVADEEEAAAEIGALLHYLPLAVEIVAQRLKSRPRQRLGQIVARLQNEQQRLDLEISDRAVRTSFAVSWAALAAELQRCFALAGVFAGRPFTAAAVAYLAAAEVDATEEWLFALEALSLVKAEGERYYRQHPLLADFAHEKLTDAAAASARMTDYYYEFAQTNQQNYAMLEPEWGNMTAAIHTAYQQGKWSLVIAFTDALAQTWQTRARYAEARQAYRWAQAAALELKDEPVQAANLLRWAEVCIQQNDYAEAKPLLTDSLARYYQIEEGAGIAAAQYHLARIAMEQNQYEQAQSWLTQSYAISQQLQDQTEMAKVLYQRARICYDFNDYVEAQRLAQAALALQDPTPDKISSRIPTLRLLAQIALMHGDLDLAQAYGEEAQQLSETSQDESELASTLYTLTGVCQYQKDYAGALRYAQRALALSQRLGLRKFEAMLFYQMSIIHEELQAYAVALDFALKSIKLYAEVEDNLSRAYALLHLGDLYQALGQTEQKRKVWCEAQIIGAGLNHHSLLRSLSRRLG